MIKRGHPLSEEGRDLSRNLDEECGCVDEQVEGFEALLAATAL